MTIHPRLIASLLTSLTLLLMIPSGESTQLDHSIIVANCGTGPDSLRANITHVSPGSSGTIKFSCGGTISAFTVRHRGSIIPHFALPPEYTTLKISSSPTCASAIALTSGSSLPTRGTLPPGDYNYCASFSHAPKAGLPPSQ